MQYLSKNDSSNSILSKTLEQIGLAEKKEVAFAVQSSSVLDGFYELQHKKVEQKKEF